MGTWHPRMAIPALSDPLGGAGHNAPYRPEGTVLSLCPPGALRRVLVLLSPAMCLLCTFVGRVQMTGSLLGDKGH